MPEVFYRKWRPQLLSDVVGQEHVTRTLRQAVILGRIAHAYLFCGPRGTGKTSTARILAKAVNCANPSDGEPCNRCPSCQAVNEGRALDMVEIDAASQRRIDDIRDLREKVHFTPAESTYKVYIVDEVHMLTSEAFNALLKTLEEPPAHAIFVLATTEAHRVPATVISRCQRFDFHRISHEDIEARLKHICNGEGIETEPQALRALARGASGSLRDAENLLEQMVVTHDSHITLGQVREMLGLGDDELALALVGHILKGETQQGLMIIGSAADQGLDLRRFHRQVVEHLRGVLLLKAGAGDALENTAEAIETMKGIADSSRLEGVLKAVRAFEQASPRQDGPSTLPLELAMVECSLDDEPTRPSATMVESARPQTETAPQVRSQQVTSRTGMPPRTVAPTPRVTRPEPTARKDPPPPPIQDSSPLPKSEAASIENGAESDLGSSGNTLPDSQWNALCKATKGMKPNKFNIGSLLLDCAGRYTEDDTLVLVFKTRPNMERMQGEIDNPATRRLIQETVEQVTGTRYNLRLSLLDQGKTGPKSPRGHLVRAARAMGVHIVGEIQEKESPNE